MSHPQAIARRMISRLAPPVDAEAPLSPTDETTDESATGDTGLLPGDDLVLMFAPVLASVAAQAWTLYGTLEPRVVARRKAALAAGDMPALQRETGYLKQLLVRRLQAEAVTPPELPETGRARILDAAAEETLAEDGS